jgi:hypothetical protein
MHGVYVCQAANCTVITINITSSTSSYNYCALPACTPALCVLLLCDVYLHGSAHTVKRKWPFKWKKKYQPTSAIRIIYKVWHRMHQERFNHARQFLRQSLSGLPNSRLQRELLSYIYSTQLERKESRVLESNHAGWFVWRFERKREKQWKELNPLSACHANLRPVLLNGNWFFFERGCLSSQLRILCNFHGNVISYWGATQL